MISEEANKPDYAREYDLAVRHLVILLEDYEDDERLVLRSNQGKLSNVI